MPPHPGLMSAIGMTHADTTRDYASPLLMTYAPGDDLAQLSNDLRDRMMRLGALADHELHVGPGQGEWSVDMRYEGQGHELNVPGSVHAHEILDAFHELHQRRYGHHNRDRNVQLVTLRFRARIKRDELLRIEVESGTADPTEAANRHPSRPARPRRRRAGLRPRPSARRQRHRRAPPSSSRSIAPP